MGLLVAFFVMLVAFSTQDQAKLNIVAGSMRDAFGMQDRVRYSGVIEVPGLPTRAKLKSAAQISPEDASATPTPDEKGREHNSGAKLDSDHSFALASASLRQALQDMPELTEMSKHIMIEESVNGLNIEIVDQDGRSMFPEGSKEPYERTRRLVQQLAMPLKSMPFRISIAGHTPHRRRRRCPATDPGSSPPIGPMRCAGCWRRKACRTVTSSWWRGKPTPTRCFPMIPSSRPIDA